jgi:replication initiator protein A
VSNPKDLKKVDETGAAHRRDFVKVEKNLSTLGFFTPSKSRGKIELVEKTIRFKREVNGKTVEAEATILPSAKYGLPTTADLDKYLAFQKILNDIRVREGQVSNPIGFSSTQMLNVLGVKTAGNNYQDVYEWLQRMTLTGISSKGVIYLAKRKAWATDTFHVFDRVVAFGMEMPDGSTAERNYVWLSDWQIENINNNYLLPIDFETYRKLRNHIAKALVPLLQVWLYASRNDGRFEKRYLDLCTILDIRQQKHRSLIKKQLGPSLDELQHYGYLASYHIEITSDGRDYKIVAEHGGKFFNDQKTRAALLLPATTPVDTAPSLLKELTNRGLSDGHARRLLQSLPEGQPVLEQLEYADWVIARSKKAIVNPTGFYIYILRENVDPPDSFESSSSRRAKAVTRETQSNEERKRLQLENEYKQFCEEHVTAYVETQMDRGEYEERLKEKAQQVKAAWPRLPVASIQEIAGRALRADLHAHVPLPSFDEFCRRHRQMPLFKAGTPQEEPS